MTENVKGFIPQEQAREALIIANDALPEHMQCRSGGIRVREQPDGTFIAKFNDCHRLECHWHGRYNRRRKARKMQARFMPPPTYFATVSPIDNDNNDWLDSVRKLLRRAREVIGDYWYVATTTPRKHCHMLFKSLTDSQDAPTRHYANKVQSPRLNELAARYGLSVHVVKLLGGADVKKVACYIAEHRADNGVLADRAARPTMPHNTLAACGTSLAPKNELVLQCQEVRIISANELARRRVARVRDKARDRTLERQCHHAASSANRRAARHNAPGRLTCQDILDALARAHGRCEYTGQVLTTWCVEHEQPMVLGGHNTPDNIRITSPRMNAIKGAMSAEQWRVHLRMFGVSDDKDCEVQQRLFEHEQYEHT